MFGLQFQVIVHRFGEVKAGTREVSHITPTSQKREGANMSLLALGLSSLLLCSSAPWVGNGVAPCLSLPISLGNQDCLAPTHKDMPAGQPDLNNSPSKLSSQVTLSCIQPAHSPSQGHLIHLLCHSDGVSRGNRKKGMCLSHCVSLERGCTPGSGQRKQSIKSLSAMAALHTPLRTVPELQCW